MVVVATKVSQAFCLNLVHERGVRGELVVVIIVYGREVRGSTGSWH